MTFADDERGLALGLVSFFGIIIVGALLFMLMDASVVDVVSISSDQAETTGGADQIGLAETIWNNMLFYVLFVAAMFIVARAVVEGERVG